MDDIELIDVFILILPILFLNIIFSMRFSFNSKIYKSRIPFTLISYSFLITTSIFVMLVIFHIHILGNRIVFHIHNFHSDVITDISSLELDFISLLVIGWFLSIIYSSLLISQLTQRFITKYLVKVENYTIDPLEMLNEKTKELLTNRHIQVKIITTDEMGFIFSLSYFSFFKKRNFIYIHDQIISMFTKNEINAAFIHEIGHFYNLDTVFFPIFNAMTKLMFFDPFLKRINQRYRDKMEEKADLFAMNYIEDPMDLARIILKLVELTNNKLMQNTNHMTKNTPILSLKSTNAKILESRINKIINYKLK